MSSSKNAIIQIVFKKPRESNSRGLSVQWTLCSLAASSHVRRPAAATLDSTCLASESQYDSGGFLLQSSIHASTIQDTYIQHWTKPQRYCCCEQVYRDLDLLTAAEHAHLRLPRRWQRSYQSAAWILPHPSLFQFHSLKPSPHG